MSSLAGMGVLKKYIGFGIRIMQQIKRFLFSNYLRNRTQHIWALKDQHISQCKINRKGSL